MYYSFKAMSTNDADYIATAAIILVELGYPITLGPSILHVHY